MYEFNGYSITIYSREDLWNLLRNEQVRLQETTYNLTWPERDIYSGRIWARLDTTFPEVNTQAIRRYDDPATGLRTFTAPNSMYYRLDIPGICQMNDASLTLVTNPRFGFTNKLAEVMWNSSDITQSITTPILRLADFTRYVLGQQLPPPPPLVSYDIEKDIKSMFGDKMAGIIMRKIK